MRRCVCFWGGTRQQLKGKKNRFLASLRNDKLYVVDQGNRRRSLFHAMQGFFGGGVGVGQGEGGAELLCGSGAVALLFE